MDTLGTISSLDVQCQVQENLGTALQMTKCMFIKYGRFQLKREPEVVSVKEEMYEDMIEQVEESTTASEGDLDQKSQGINVCCF